MKTTLKKLSALILMLGTIFILSFPSIAHAADTGGTDHFELTVVENKDSKSGAEIADLTIKNISGKTGTNVTFEADLPTIFHDKDMKQVTFKVGTLKAGESRTYQVSRKAAGTVATTSLPTTGNNATTALPTTGDMARPLVILVGLFLLASIVTIGFRRFKGAKSLFAILLLLAGLGGVATVYAAETYHHRDEVRNHAVELAGTTYVFHLAGEGDFEEDNANTGDTGGDNGGSEVTKNFTITYYINGVKVTNLSLVYGYVAGEQATDLKTPTYEAEDFSGWYDNDTYTGNVITSIAKEATGDKVFYGKTTPKTYQVTFDSTGGEAVASETVNHGQTVSEPVAPTKDDAINPADAPEHDFIFKGWYTEPDLTTPFDFETPMTENITLYAKWGLPITEAGLVNPAVASYADGKLGTPGDAIWFANAWFQILDEDMDDDASNGLQALVIKVYDIGNSQFIADTTRYGLYFDNITSDGDSADGSNGYEDSRNPAIGGVGKFIDDWYNANIEGTVYESSVQAVALNNPNYTDFTQIPFTFDSGSTITNWIWKSYYQDTRFATILDVSGYQQAFALSYGDIHGHMGIAPPTTFTHLLDFQPTTHSVNPTFWLRSAGDSYRAAGRVDAGSINNLYRVHLFYPVRPALSLLID
ncbi:hypothetical protein FACS1894193_03440 [Bacilli bacterium]|nr:hypothetical protein FACS1894192_06460 [Bacilli bacterium]GHU40723.1 hypothetical protein FACS1894193_03440 [Bacilli bacterium]